MADKPQIHTFRPKERESVRHIPQTAEDRAQQLKEFREDQEHKQKIKEERFAEIEKRRKNRPSSGKSGGGINVEVTSENKKN